MSQIPLQPTLRLITAPHAYLTRGQLAESTGLSEKTIGRYIAVGLVDRPLGHARAARYTKTHKDQIRSVRAALANGQSLDELVMKKQFSDGTARSGKDKKGPKSNKGVREIIAVVHRLSPHIELHSKGELTSSEQALQRWLLEARRQFDKSTP